MRAVSTGSTGEILDGLWRFEAIHPEWEEEEEGDEDWLKPLVGWWAVRVPAGLVLIDPLIEEWPALDRLIEAQGGCAGIIRTVHWHRRSIPEAASRYQAGVWAKPRPDGSGDPPFDEEVRSGEELFERIVAYEMERDDEIALWLPEQAALIFGDAMLRGEQGRLTVCPASWLQPKAGAPRMRSLLRDLTRLPVEHVLVSHGPLVLGHGLDSLREATG